MAATILIAFGIAARSVIWSLAKDSSSASVVASAGLELHVGDRQFAGVHVGAADRRGELHGRVPVQRLLDARGVDVVAAPDDELLLAAGQVEVAVRVLAAEVAGVQPAPAVAEVQPRALVVIGVR